MTPFHLTCPEPGLRETRCLHVLVPGDRLPVGEYGFIEFYCEDPGCDCRRVLLQVTSRAAPRTPLAVINFGWENVGFYTDWMHGDEQAGRDIASASLDPLHPQSEYADHFLEFFQSEMMTDRSYVARLQAHYKLFKSRLRSPAQAASRPGRNDPCPCGSGKKYKKCCGAD